MFGTTGLSDAPLLAYLISSGRAFVVRLDVSEEAARRRIVGRARGRHLSDDWGVNQQLWRTFHEHALPEHRVDLEIDTEASSVESVTSTILAALVDFDSAHGTN